MTWPTDGLPRFTAGSVPKGWSQGAVPEPAEGYVYDRAYCHRVVATVKTNEHSRAQRYAAELAVLANAGEARPATVRGYTIAPSQHGETAWREKLCGCDVCREATSAAHRHRRIAARGRA